MGNIGSALGRTTNGALPYAGIDRYLSWLLIGPLTANNNATLWEPSFVPCYTTDWERINHHCCWRRTITWRFPFRYSLPSTHVSERLPARHVYDEPRFFTPTFIDYNWKSPYMIQYNASVQQQLPWNMALGVAYVGNHGIHLPMVRDGNPIIPTSFGPCGDPASVCVDGKVPFWDNEALPPTDNVNPNYGSDINIATVATSRYNALQVVLQKRTTHGLEFEGAYTHSQVTDETQGQANIQDCIVSGGLLGTYPLNPRVDKGPACFNVPNNWEFNVLYHFPNPMARRLYGQSAGRLVHEQHRERPERPAIHADYR